MPQFKQFGFWLAVVLTLACSLAGTFLSNLPGLSLIGALIIALILGMLLQLVPNVKSKAEPGIGWISNKFIRAGIILLGFRLNLVVLAESGIKNLVFAAFIVTITIIINYIILRHIFKVGEELSLLTSSGCGICGAAAIMGIKPQINADTDDSVLAVAVIAILGTLFTLIEVGLHAVGAIGLNPVQFGTFAGGSLHEIAHAVAAGGAAGDVGLDASIITKLSRVLMLAPVAVLVGIFYQRKKGSASGSKNAKVPIPWFMGGFLIASALGSFLPFTPEMLEILVKLAYILLGMAMAALGMSVNFGVIKVRGARVFAGATIGSIIQLFICLGVASTFF